MRLILHGLGLIANALDAERADQPVRLALVIAAHMLAADQRDVFAEALLVQRDQRGAVAVLLVGHFLEHPGRGRVFVAQPVGIGAVDAAVILFGGYGKSQDFLLGQRIERAAAEAEDAR